MADLPTGYGTGRRMWLVADLLRMTRGIMRPGGPGWKDRTHPALPPPTTLTGNRACHLGGADHMSCGCWATCEAGAAGWTSAGLDRCVDLKWGKGFSRGVGHGLPSRRDAKRGKAWVVQLHAGRVGEGPGPGVRLMAPALALVLAWSLTRWAGIKGHP